MKAILNPAFLVALATTTASATEMSNINNHREKRALPKLLAYTAGGSGASPLPPHVDPNIGMSTDMLHEMPIEASFSGPLATLGVLLILISAFMAANYFQAVNNAQLNAQLRRSVYAGQHIQKRSTFDINPDSILSLINSFR